VIALLVNTNQFSLHAMYRARLIRAYLGASNGEPRRNPFTGFDERDNIGMSDLCPNPPSSSPPSAGTASRRSLFHVVNMALNLVHGDRLAWQERKAHSFTVSPLHAGSLAVDAAGGYPSTRFNPGGPQTPTGGGGALFLVTH